MGNKKTVWLVGCRGMLGQDLAAVLADAGLEVVGTDREVDFTDPAALEAFYRQSFGVNGKKLDWIVNCAAYTAVDKAEDEPDLCRRLNVVGPGNLAALAERNGAAMVHVSTDYVFSGEGIAGQDGQLRPYREDDPVAPQGIYGQTKADGESAVLNACSRSVILRTAWLYGAHGPNFVFTMLRLMKERESLGVVADQWGSPTWTMDLAKTVLAVLSAASPVYGVFHASGEGLTNWHAFALEIQRKGFEKSVLKHQADIKPLATTEYPTRARRPAWSVLNKSRLRAAYGISLPQWQDSLAVFFERNMGIMQGRKFKNVLVTGGAGFIGSNFVRYLLGMGNLDCHPFGEFQGRIVNVDVLTYAGNAGSLADVDARYGVKALGKDKARYVLEQADICDRTRIEQIFTQYEIDTVVHFAAESHVDRSIHGPEAFIRTNVMGTFTLLDVARNVWTVAQPDGAKALRQDVLFHHVSTDEVYGSLGETGYFFETTPYDPRSPYSSSKAASDHLVNAWHHTYGLPVTMSNCSNNYGPFQFPEKLIPVMIMNMQEGKALPVYGDGRNIRDWLYVEDHNSAVWAIMNKGRVGECYNIGGENEWENIRLLKAMMEIMARLKSKPVAEYEKLITYVKDRPGHDRRYAINCDKLKGELGWKQSVTFEEGLQKTIQWYLDNGAWIDSVRSGEYRTWIEKNYSAR